MTGQDFSANHQSINISYTSSHLWPANWAAAGGLAVIFPEAFSGNWIEAHIRASAQLGKPLILSEFGHTRDTAR
jgi:mannan endo-1,4-beta-mannosidase